MIGVVVFVERGQRRIPIQHARRVVGKRVMQGGMQLPPAAGEHGGRDPADLRFVAADVPADDRPVHRLAGGADASSTDTSTRRSWLYNVHLRRADHLLLLTSTPRS